ncbi:hypothetical protein FRB99_008167 [Tulasnella sp. 403]|nr:hypothetical protein FRB99_008167 [Tulasnella sp. 403]
MPYLDSLPPHQLLSSSLTFNSNELKLVKGTNLLGATQSRKDELLREHQDCQSVFTQSDRSLAEGFTFERYLTAAIYLSSRAFPSTLLDRSPTVVSSPDSPAHPVLLPIVDSLNHARGQPVTWLVEDSPADSTETSTRDDSLRISVVCGTDVPAGCEVFNNYGAKPNSELILGYGFALENNPDDTIVLQLSGSPKKWEVGRKENPSSSRTLQALFEEACETTVSKWKDVTRKETGAAFDDEDIEDEIILLRRDATLFLLEATRRKLQALPPLADLEDALNVRQAVREMIKWYVQGQHDVLNYVNEFFEEKLKTIEAELDGMGIQYLSDDEGPST